MSRVAHLLNTTVNVWRYTEVSDGMGGWIRTWADLGPVRARIAQPSAHERTAADKASVRLDAVVYLPPTADVRRGDELRRPGHEPLTVDAVYMPSAPVYKRAECTADQVAA